jgi:lactoylglutathione lyase
MRFHHFALEVSDLERSIAFYQKYLGLHEDGRIEWNKENMVFLKMNDFRLELISGGQHQVSGGIHICLEVDNVQEVIHAFNEDGISALEGPYKLKNGWEIVFYQGPDNEVVEFLQIGETAGV